MKSVPGTLFFKAMKDEPRIIPFLGIGNLIDAGCAPYRPGEKCLDRRTGKVVTIVSCEPVRVSEVTEEDAIKLGFTFDEHNQVMARENFENDWHKRHPGKEWAWRVESEEERDVTRNNRGYGIL